MLVYNDEKHLYTWNGLETPSVTQVLSRVAVKNGEHWNSISGSEFITDHTAAEFGTAFHEVAHCIIRNVKCEYDPVLEPWVRGFKKFMKENGIHPHNFWMYENVVTEKPLYSKKYRYAGTADLYLGISTEFCNSSVVYDWKTSVQFQDHFRMQLAAYDQLIKENYGVRKHIGRKCVRIFKDGYEVKDYKKTRAADWNDFLSILNVYKKFSK